MLPALIAGLPFKRAIVCVGPPLFCKGPSSGLIGEEVDPRRSLAP